MRQIEAKNAPRISDLQAEFEAAWQGQIDALTEPGLTDEERVRRFAEAAEFTPVQLSHVFALMRDHAILSAWAVWSQGWSEKSLFAFGPNCNCPVNERMPGVPHAIPADWHPTAADLEPFRTIQRNWRFPS